MLEQKNVTVKAGSSFQTICPFPVGYIYQSYNGTSPANIYGGSWIPITGRFLYCNNNTNIGGSNSIMLQAENIPPHTHTPSNRTIMVSKNRLGNLAIGPGKDFASVGYLREYHPSELDRVGVFDTATIYPISIMPAYQTCYAWRRTA